jgi:hypothetical protein
MSEKMCGEQLKEKLGFHESQQVPDMFISRKLLPYDSGNSDIFYVVETHRENQSNCILNPFDRFSTMKLSAELCSDPEAKLTLAQFECSPADNEGNVNIRFHPDIEKYYDPDKVFVAELASEMSDEILFLGEVYQHIIDKQHIAAGGKYLPPDPIESYGTLYEIGITAAWIVQKLGNVAVHYVDNRLYSDGTEVCISTVHSSDGSVIRTLSCSVGKIKIQENISGKIEIENDDIKKAEKLLKELS